MLHRRKWAMVNPSLAAVHNQENRVADASILETSTRMADVPARRTKICVVGLRGVPGVMGGIESHCEQIFPRLKRLSNDYDITIIGRRPYVGDAIYEYEGIRVVPLPAARSKYLEAITNTALAVIYARFRERAQVVHIHGIGPALLGPLARLLGMSLAEFDERQIGRAHV